MSIVFIGPVVSSSKHIMHVGVSLGRWLVVVVVLRTVLLLALAGTPLKPHLLEEKLGLSVWHNFKFHFVTIIHAVQLLYCAGRDVVNECTVRVKAHKVAVVYEFGH